MTASDFEWDADKERANIEKHGVGFAEAALAFRDPHLVIMADEAHSTAEKRWWCFGTVEGEVLTVRFTYRSSVVRIFGAGYWRKGTRIYEEENRIH